ncbi:MAG: single-stranded-DNA-specific exonuclease RecJ [candidate division NC10 bacterium]|nr:single-stranded-DNA-specific exonuclease RecJ [candidate division NC10 bacterium]
MSRRWLISQVDPGEVEALAREAGISPLLSTLLLNRGCKSPAQARIFLDSPLESLHSPFLMKGMAQAASRLAQAIHLREKVLLYGDYDVDGISGTALLLQVLRGLGGAVAYHLPKRLEEGYGLRAEVLHRARDEGFSVVITVDHGTAAVEEAALARELGLDLIISDHHHPPPVLPPAYAILNPQQEDCPYPFKGLAGVGVAFKLAQAVWFTVHGSSAGGGAEGGGVETCLLEYLDLVALGTIADVVPLTGENRILVRHGLQRMVREPRPGIAALREEAGLRDGPISAGQVAFILAPRVNAPGRLSDPSISLRLLIAQEEGEARALAMDLGGQNRERQRIERDILAEARQAILDMDQSRSRAIVLARRGWHPGVIGIVASRLVEEFYRPAVLIALEDGKGRGSARGIGSLDLYQALDSCKDHLIAYGGHRLAAGFTINEDEVEAFRHRFQELARETLGDEDLEPSLKIDAEVFLDELSLEVAAELEKLPPYGLGNPEPTLLARGLQVMKYPRQVGENHLKIKVRQKEKVIGAIGFSMAGLQGEITGSPYRTHIAFYPEIDRYGGRQTLRLRIKALLLGEEPNGP